MLTVKPDKLQLRHVGAGVERCTSIAHHLEVAAGLSWSFLTSLLSLLAVINLHHTIQFITGGLEAFPPRTLQGHDIICFA